ncbi:hypothetical protein BC828DRAFT_137828 [Blastocladiella britannica]|nr:hypothetical protein BC828DRAFT_137828 [Blastocladiella britannica]
MPPKKTIKPTPVTVAPLTVTEYAQKFTAAKTYAARAALHADVVSRENQLRGLFAQQRTIAPEVQDPNVLLLPVHDLPAPLRTVPKVFEEERAIPVVMPNADKLPEGRQVIADRTEFLLNWKLFTAGALDCIDWNNMFAAGGSIQACLTHLPPNTTYGERRDYFLEKHGSADVDLFVYGLSPAAAMEKMNKIYDQVMDAVPFDVVAVRTSHAVTIVSQYPYRHIQIVLRLYKSPAETLMGFDVDSCAVGYNGVSVLCTPRAHFALITQANTVDMTRRSPTYESRLAKYAQRGYEVRVPGLTRERIDPQIYERSFDKVRGLGRLLLFEALGDQENRMRFKEIQRERKGRPPHPHAGRYESRNHLRAGDLKAQEAFESSDYQSVFLPFGPAYNAARIVRVLNKKDRGMNNAWFMRKRGVKVHQHPCFFGFMSEVMEDACGACPRAKTQKDKDDLDGYVHGPLKFITDDPGRQSIGSFHPITDEEWSVDAYIDPKRSPLFAAVAHGTVEDMTSLLTKLGPDFDLESRDWTGRTLLQLATMCGRLDMVELLLKRGARVSAPLPDGRLPIHVAAEYGLVEIAKRLWAKQVANAEIEAAKPKADPAEAVDVDAMDVDDEEDKDDDEDEDDEDDDYGGSDEGDDDDDAMDEDQDDDDGQAKKTRAGKDKGKKKGGDDDGDEDDEELGPDVHSIDHRDWDFKMAPIHYAVMYGHIDLVRWLIEVGASPTREFTSKSGYQFSDTWHPLSLTLLTPDRTVGKAISELLLEHGATATQEILLACLQHGATEFLLHLLEVDPSASKPEVIQALFNASLCQDNADLVREFIKRGAVVHFTIEEIMRRDGTDRNSAENTLMYITQPITMVIPQYGNPKAEFAKILVEAGAATNFKYSRWSNDALIGTCIWHVT